MVDHHLTLFEEAIYGGSQNVWGCLEFQLFFGESLLFGGTRRWLCSRRVAVLGGVLWQQARAAMQLLAMQLR